MQQPTTLAPPSSASGTSPYERYIDYRPGKTAPGYVDIATPERAKAGFSYWDKDQKETVKVPEFTATVIGVLASVSGATKDSDGRYWNYGSNYVFDSRQDTMVVRLKGAKEVTAQGIYKKEFWPLPKQGEQPVEGRNYLPEGVGYQMSLAVFCKEAKEIWVLEISATLQTAIINAIAQACNIPAKKVSLFNLCTLSTRFWTLKFGPGFEQKNVKGEPYSGHGDMFFLPQITVSTVEADNTAGIAFLNEKADLCRDWANGYQEKLRKDGGQAAPANGYEPNNPNSPDPFAPRPASAPARVESDASDWPTTIVADDHEDATADIDTLPF